MGVTSCSRPDGRQVGVQQVGRHPSADSGAQIKILPHVEKRARLQRRHFTIPPVQQSALPQAGAHLPDGGEIQRVIGVVPGTTAVARGKPSGSKLDIITLTWGKSGR